MIQKQTNQKESSCKMAEGLPAYGGMDDPTMGAGDKFADDGVSPFRPPNDEEVFVTRETEKQKRKEAKE